jgi:hypothetical protein
MARKLGGAAPAREKSRPARLNAGERLIEVGDQVLDVFDAH